MSEFVKNSKEAIEEAEQEGLRIVLPSIYELQLDVDGENSYRIFERNLNILRQYWEVDHHEVQPSRSGDIFRKHITVTLAEPVVSNYERIALQCFLGSDPTRELCSWIKADQRDAQPTMFFESKVEKAAMHEDMMRSMLEYVTTPEFIAKRQRERKAEAKTVKAKKAGGQ